MEPDEFDVSGVHTFTIPLSFRFGVDYEYDIRRQTWTCYGAYYTKTDTYTMGPYDEKTEELAKERCKDIIKRIWWECVR